ncbi:MAG: hypothetical protein RDU25_00285 [Patescibacteria group bacterium]|nr:hypothetical protein [Patescibacteria group bacterium]
MSTKQELAVHYAAQLSHALRLDEARGSKTARRAPSLEEAIRDVVRQVDGMYYERTGRKLSAGEKYELYGLIAAELGVSASQWGIIKESSIAQALSFEQLLVLLMQKVTYV